MAADPLLMRDTSSSRTVTGVGIALLVVATIAAAALLAPRLREEFHEDMFARPAPSTAAARVAAPPARTPAAAAPAPAAPKVAAREANPAAPVAAAPVPAGSLGPGEAVVKAPPAPVLKKANRIATPVHHRKHPPAP